MPLNFFAPSTARARDSSPRIVSRLLIMSLAKSFFSTLFGRSTLHAGHYNWHECKWYHYGQLGSDIWVFFNPINERNWRLLPTFHSRVENTFGEIIADGNFNTWFMSGAVGGIMFRFASSSIETTSARQSFLERFKILGKCHKESNFNDIKALKFVWAQKEFHG